jgi:uncharacterized RDD family membrane protein YckC
MFCARCGAQAAPDATFCVRCGAPLEGDSGGPLPSIAGEPLEGAEVPGVPRWLELASVRRRYGAVFVDQLVLTAGYVLIGLALTRVPESDTRGIVGLFAFVVVAWVYYAGLIAFGGETLGKRLFKIRVVRSSGGRVSFARATSRFFVSWIPLEVLAALYGDRRQCLHDRVADTIVVARSNP